MARDGKAWHAIVHRLLRVGHNLVSKQQQSMKILNHYAIHLKLINIIIEKMGKQKYCTSLKITRNLIFKICTG